MSLDLHAYWVLPSEDVEYLLNLIDWFICSFLIVLFVSNHPVSFMYSINLILADKILIKDVLNRTCFKIGLIYKQLFVKCTNIILQPLMIGVKVFKIKSLIEKQR